MKRILVSALVAMTCCTLVGQEKDKAHKHTNALAKETSPYLLLHAHNPVDWYGWSEATLKKAKDENKVIFLSVGYSSCHWCHVMERESFEDDGIAALLEMRTALLERRRKARRSPDLARLEPTRPPSTGVASAQASRCSIACKRS